MSKKKIMIVDDEDTILNLVKIILEEENYEVFTANNGKECLDLLKKVKPNLILLDLMMPSMSGIEVCKKIRSNPKFKQIKIIYLTVVGVSELEREMLKKSNIVDYIQKPFDNKELITRIKKALR